MNKLCENCRTITTCLEMGCGQGYSKKPAIEELQRQIESLQRENEALRHEREQARAQPERWR